MEAWEGGDLGTDCRGEILCIMSMVFLVSFTAGAGLLLA